MQSKKVLSMDTHTRLAYEQSTNKYYFALIDGTGWHWLNVDIQFAVDQIQKGWHCFSVYDLQSTLNEGK